jgi:two-component system, sensor histidine kinase and response regulator
LKKDVKKSLAQNPLRQKAEQLLKKKYSERLIPNSEADILKLIHELEVHQIELEMQAEELRQANSDLALKNAHEWQTTFDAVNDAIWLLDKNQKIVRVNRASEKIFNLFNSEFIGNCCFEQMHGMTGPIFNCPIMAAKESLSRQTTELKIGEKWFHISGDPILDGKGSYNGCIHIASDITERKIAENDLIINNERFTQVAESSGIWIWETNAEGLYTYVNAMEETILGFGPEELIGKKYFYDSFAPEMKDDLTKKAFEVFSKKESFKNFRNLNIHKSGRHVMLETSGVPIVDEKGTLLGYRGADKDITERNRFEEIIQANEVRLLELNATKDKFFSIIAHDLLNPLNNVLGFSELLIAQVQKKDYTTIEKYSDAIYHSSMLSLSLLSNLLEWSRLQSGRMKFNPELIEISTLLTEVTALFIDSVPKKPISFFIENIDQLTVYADREMLSAILRNLISNAFKFSYPGGKINISAEQNEHNIILSVTDSGTGIKAHATENLFRMDESYSTKGTQNESGTGLGLLLCKEFVEKHGGKIWVNSEWGKGSRFSFSIPKI